ncbi:hypothetical protein BJ170DRAFT_678782 [Xylariales sp. AK1849]|nr:hypothetical protein BJ170DRAFT_678782 [Xylariales sp. AK1849]
MEIKPPPRLEKGFPILVFGAGTWGTAIVYRWAQRGYTNIKVLDSNDFPSAIAAGNDVNKIIEEAEDTPSPEQDNELYAWAVIDSLATEVWKTELVYSPHHHSWRGFIRRKTAGWIEAQDNMKDAFAEAVKMSATFICDPEEGGVLKYLYFDLRDVFGALTAAGTMHTAHTTVLAAGASSSLLLEFEDQLRPVHGR